jgi:hypothetical protein
VYFYNDIWCYNQDDNKFHSDYCENLKSDKGLLTLLRSRAGLRLSHSMRLHGNLPPANAGCISDFA